MLRLMLRLMLGLLIGAILLATFALFALQQIVYTVLVAISGQH